MDGLPCRGVMKHFLHILVLVLLVTVARSAMAFGGGHRVMNWSDLLELTDQQQQQIKNIESDYQQRFQKLRDTHGPDWGESFDEQQWLQERLAARDLFASMRIELQSALTSEQREKADGIVREFHSRATRDIIRRMSRGVELTEEQQADLDVLTKQVIEQFSWPVDHSQIEAGRVGIERVLGEVLTAEQLEVVQQREREERRSWPQLDNLTGSPFREPELKQPDGPGASGGFMEDRPKGPPPRGTFAFPPDGMGSGGIGTGNMPPPPPNPNGCGISPNSGLEFPPPPPEDGSSRCQPPPQR